MCAETILMALRTMGQNLADQGLTIDIMIAGCIWMALVQGPWGVREDIEAYLPPPSEPVRSAVQAVARQLHLPSDWLAWVFAEQWTLATPWFLISHWKLRAWLLVATPPPWKRRRIFGGDETMLIAVCNDSRI